jgi:uncharacterized protein YjbJ (UPF0337 family)
MSIRRTIAHKTKVARGAIKQFLGRATGDTRLRNEGRLDRATGNAARTVDKLGDAFKP